MAHGWRRRSIGSLGKGGAFAVVADVALDKARISRAQNGLGIKTWQGGVGFDYGRVRPAADCLPPQQHMLAARLMTTPTTTSRSWGRTRPSCTPSPDEQAAASAKNGRRAHSSELHC